MTRSLVSLALLLALSAGLKPRPTSAQAPPRPASAQVPPSARDSAPVDLTGYWVSYVTENWRYRMVTPAKGEYRRIPSSPAALPLINGWDPAADDKAGNQCKSYGAAAIMNVPGRLRITWQDASTLRIETDAGTQTRRLRFTTSGPGSPTRDSAKAGAATWQGDSTARWEPAASGDGGSLRVVTSNLRAGYLRKNGVPYSERTTLTEHFDVAPLPGGGQLLLVNTVVDDPVYLNAPYVTSPHFKKEPDGSKWDPTPCSSTW
jgi:hypothetical protein